MGDIPGPGEIRVRDALRVAGFASDDAHHFLRALGLSLPHDKTYLELADSEKQDGQILIVFSEHALQKHVFKQLREKGVQASLDRAAIRMDAAPLEKYLHGLGDIRKSPEAYDRAYGKSIRQALDAAEKTMGDSFPAMRAYHLLKEASALKPPFSEHDAKIERTATLLYYAAEDLTQAAWALPAGQKGAAKAPSRQNNLFSLAHTCKGMSERLSDLPMLGTRRVHEDRLSTWDETSRAVQDGDIVPRWLAINSKGEQRGVRGPAGSDLARDDAAACTLPPKEALAQYSQQQLGAFNRHFQAFKAKGFESNDQMTAYKGAFGQFLLTSYQGTLGQLFSELANQRGPMAVAPAGAREASGKRGPSPDAVARNIDDDMRSLFQRATQHGFSPKTNKMSPWLDMPAQTAGRMLEEWNRGRSDANAVHIVKAYTETERAQPKHAV